MTTGQEFRDAVEAEFDDPSVLDTLLVEAVAATLDEIGVLMAAVERDGPVVQGSRGQPVTHPAVAELRHHRAALAKLLSQLAAEPHGGETQSQRQRRYAQARWSRPR